MCRAYFTPIDNIHDCAIAGDRRSRHGHIAAFDACQAIRLVLEARQTWCEVIKFLNTFVEILDGKPWGLLDCHIDIVDAALSCINITHSK